MPSAPNLNAKDWRAVIVDYKAKVAEATGKPFPTEPKDQLWGTNCLNTSGIRASSEGLSEPAAFRAGTVKANKYRLFSASNPAERVGDS